MIKEEAKLMVTELITKLKEYDKQRSALSQSLGDWWASPFGNSVCELFDLSIRNVERAIGDKTGGLVWFIYDCDYGANPLECVIDGKATVCDSVDSYLETLEFEN